jgi:hypothetical protein
MNTGALRLLVTLDTPNGANGYLPLDPPSWWCAPVSQGSDQATLLVGRFHPGINTKTRVTYPNGQIFHVDSVINREQRDVELLVTCREVFS